MIARAIAPGKNVARVKLGVARVELYKEKEAAPRTDGERPRRKPGEA
jgi:hypothetical protein